MCWICGINGGINGIELICDKCHSTPKEMKDFLTALGIRRYDKLTKNRYR